MEKCWGKGIQRIESHHLFGWRSRFLFENRVKKKESVKGLPLNPKCARTHCVYLERYSAHVQKHCKRHIPGQNWSLNTRFQDSALMEMIVTFGGKGVKTPGLFGKFKKVDWILIREALFLYKGNKDN